MKVRVQKRQSYYGKYKSISITMPKEILGQAKWLKKQRIVDLEVDLLGHITIKP